MKKHGFSIFLLSLCTVGLITPLTSCQGDSSSESAIEISSSQSEAQSGEESSEVTSEEEITSESDPTSKECTHNNVSLSIIAPQMDNKGKVKVECDDCHEMQTADLPMLSEKGAYEVTTTMSDCTASIVDSYKLLKTEALINEIKNKITIVDKEFVLNRLFMDERTITYKISKDPYDFHDIEIEEVKKPTYDQEGQYNLKCKRCGKVANVLIPEINLNSNQYVFTYSKDAIKADIQLPVIKNALSNIKDFKFDHIDDIANSIKTNIGVLDVTSPIKESKVLFNDDGSTTLMYKDYLGKQHDIETDISWKKDLVLFFEIKYVSTSDCAHPVKKLYYLNKTAKDYIDSLILNDNVRNNPMVIDAINKANYEADWITKEEIEAHISAEGKHEITTVDVVKPTETTEGKLTLKCKNYDKCKYVKEIAIAKLTEEKYVLSYEGKNITYKPKSAYVYDIYLTIKNEIKGTESELLGLIYNNLIFQVVGEITLNVTKKADLDTKPFEITILVKGKVIEVLKSPFTIQSKPASYFTTKLVEISCDKMVKNYYLSEQGAAEVAALSKNFEAKDLIPLLTKACIAELAPTDSDIRNNKTMHHQLVLTKLECVYNNDTDRNSTFAMVCSNCNKEFFIKFSRNDACELADEETGAYMVLPENLMAMFASKYPMLTDHELGAVESVVINNQYYLCTGKRL